MFMLRIFWKFLNVFCDKRSPHQCWRFMSALPELRNRSWGVLMLFPAPVKELKRNITFSKITHISIFYTRLVPQGGLDSNKHLSDQVWTEGIHSHKNTLCLVGKHRGRGKWREVPGKQRNTMSAATVQKVIHVQPSGLLSDRHLPFNCLSEEGGWCQCYVIFAYSTVRED